MREIIRQGRLGATLLTGVLFAACGGGGDAGEGGATGGGGAAAPAASPVDAATAGTITGRIMFTGTPAAPEPIDMRDEPQCAEKHEGQPVMETARVSDGGLADVFVYVKSGPVDQMQFPTPTEATVIDQVGCEYVPHVSGVMTNQQLTFRNSDPLMHNVNVVPDVNRGFGFSQPTAGMETSRTLSMAEVMVPVRCDVHGWMESYVGVTAHPYHAVSAEGGAFSLDNLPPGDYELEAWHEVYGVLTQTVTVPASGNVEVTFAFNDQMAGRHVPLGEPLWVDHATGTFRRGPAPAHAGHQQ